MNEKAVLVRFNDSLRESRFNCEQELALLYGKREEIKGSQEELDDERDTANINERVEILDERIGFVLKRYSSFNTLSLLLLDEGEDAFDFLEHTHSCINKAFGVVK